MVFSACYFILMNLEKNENWYIGLPSWIYIRILVTQATQIRGKWSLMIKRLSLFYVSPFYWSKRNIQIRFKSPRPPRPPQPVGWLAPAPRVPRVRPPSVLVGPACQSIPAVELPARRIRVPAPPWSSNTARPWRLTQRSSSHLLSVKRDGSQRLAGLHLLRRTGGC